VAAQVVDAPGASDVAWQVAAVRFACVAGLAIVSVTATEPTATLPALRTVKAYVTLAPTLLTVVGVGVLVSTSAGVRVAVTVADDAGEVTAAPPALVPVATAVLATLPASRSACVVV
jgi:hypothetical protein